MPGIGTAIAAGIGSAISGIAGPIIGSAIAAKSSDQASSRAYDAQIATNEANMKMNAENIALQEKENEKNRQWQKQENDIARMREDNAMQRAVADQMAAGLSPLGSNAASAQSMQAALGTAPQNKFAAGSGGFLEAARLQAQKGSDIAAGINAALRNVYDLQDIQTRQTVGNAQAAFASAKADETNINNSTLWFRNILSAIHLKKEIDKIDVDTRFEKLKKDNYQNYINSLIEQNFANASLSNAQSFHTYGSENREQAVHDSAVRFGERYDYPIGTSYSASFNGPYNIYSSAMHGGQLFADRFVDPVVSAGKDMFGKAKDMVMSGLDFSQAAAVRDMALANLQSLYQSGKVKLSEYLDKAKKIWTDPRGFQLRSVLKAKSSE